MQNEKIVITKGLNKNFAVKVHNAQQVVKRQICQYRNPLKTNSLNFILIGKISKICDPTVSVVFTCSDPPLVMTYDFVIGLHSVWHATKAKAEVSTYM